MAALVCLAMPARAQDVEQDTTFDLGTILGDDGSGGLTVSSGKTYNRVEGLPVLFGPVYRGSLGPGEISMSALGILRSAHNFSWDSENIGHRLSASFRVGRRRGLAVGAEAFDVVSKIEPWQLTEPDGGLAAFFLKRDYFDFFGRHGARGYLSAFRGNASVTLGVSEERWSSRRSRDVYSLFRGDDAWRENPRINDGVARVIHLGFHHDSRNNPLDPVTGWFLNADYERGSGRFETEGTGIAPELADGRADLGYGRLFLDLRRYNRISPKRRLNTRLVVGGWIHGDRLPYQRRFSVGGIGTLPGYDFRRVGIGTDVGQCADESSQFSSRPAQCERVILAQAEYRQELPSELFDIFNRNRIRVRGAVFRVKPDVVAFADAGRGWLLGPRSGTLRYTSGSLPGIDTFRTDVGLGLDLGIVGMYVAKAVADADEPANFFLRINTRF
jgi:hypothetical protein